MTPPDKLSNARPGDAVSGVKLTKATSLPASQENRK